MLDNISVTENDIMKICPDVLNIKHDNIISFNDIITECKRITYGKIKEDYIINENLDSRFRFGTQFGSNAQIDTTLAKIKDFPEEAYLKNRIVRMAIAFIYKQNGDYDSAMYWDNEVNLIPLKYYVDDDADQTVDWGEQVVARRMPTLGR